MKKTITVEQLFKIWFGEVKTLVNNTMVNNPNYKNGYYFLGGCSGSGQAGNLIEDVKRWAGYITDKLNELESLTIEYLAPEPYDFTKPDHYKLENGREVIDLMIDQFGIEKVAAFCEVNAFKYASRKGKKPGEDEARESAKMKWYEEKAKELHSKIKLK